MGSLVSIIIPAYNAEEYITDCIKSCIAQTYKNIEIIVIDDGSKDRTYEIVQEYSEKYNNIVIIHTENKGVSNARNLGIESASGEYISFVDADDELFPNAIYDLLKCSYNYDADIVSGANILVVPGIESYLHTGSGKIKIWENCDMIEGVIADDYAIYAVWAKLYKKEFISDIHFRSGQAVHEDSYFLFKCALKKPKMVVLDTVVYKYFVRKDSVTSQVFSEKKYYDIINGAEQKFEEIKKLYPEYEEKAYNVILKANMAVLCNIIKIYDKSWRTKEKKCIRNIKMYKKYFISASDSNEKLFFIITHNMYYIFKLLYNMKLKLKK